MGVLAVQWRPEDLSGPAICTDGGGIRRCETDPEVRDFGELGRAWQGQAWAVADRCEWVWRAGSIERGEAWVNRRRTKSAGV